MTVDGIVDLIYMFGGLVVAFTAGLSIGVWTGYLHRKNITDAWKSLSDDWKGMYQEKDEMYRELDKQLMSYIVRELLEKVAALKEEDYQI